MKICQKNQRCCLLLANFRSEPNAKRAKQAPKVLDGAFFTIVKRDGDSIVAACCVCKEEKKG